jgi:hypothetical protein
MATPMPLPAGGGEIRNSRSPSFLASIAYSAAEISSLRGVGEYRGKQPLFARQRPEDLASLQQFHTNIGRSGTQRGMCRVLDVRQVQVFESQISVARTESPSTP